MAKIILFSQPTDKSLAGINPYIFSKKDQKLNFVYMPSEGINSNAKKHKPFWKKYITENSNYNFIVVDNSKVGDEAEEEKDKIAKADILFITGGNTFTLLRNIKRNGMDQSIIEFSKKQDKLLVGFSAGALILTPSIQIVAFKETDENLVGLDDLTSLNIVDFEISPHYSNKWLSTINKYQDLTGKKVRTISDDEFIIISQA